MWVAPPPAPAASSKTPPPSGSTAHRSDNAPTSAPTPEPGLASRRHKHLNRRIVLLTNRTAELVKGFDPSTLASSTLLALAGALGTNTNAKTLWVSNGSSTPWPNYHRLLGMSSESFARTFWENQLRPVLLARLQYQGPSDTDRLLHENREALALIGQDPDAIFREVAAQLAEPKAWASHPDYVAEVLAELTLPMPSAEFLARDHKATYGTSTTDQLSGDSPETPAPQAGSGSRLRIPPSGPLGGRGHDRRA